MVFHVLKRDHTEKKRLRASEDLIWGFTPETGLYIQGVEKANPLGYYMPGHEIY